MKIWAHTLVKNEERYLWFAVCSVIDFVDKILLWDTGSTDRTVEVIQKLKEKYPDKISFREYGNVDSETYTVARSEILSLTKADWFIMLDGDEVWYRDSIARVRKEIDQGGSILESIAVPTINLVGDIFHYQEEAAGNYKILGRRGHLSLKGINMRIPGLQIIGPHGQMGWADNQKRMIQDRDPKKIKFLDAPLFHATHLVRSGSGGRDTDVVKRKMKKKYEIGLEFGKDYFFPEAFFEGAPEFIESPWQVMSLEFKFRAFFETPLRKLKRRLLPAKIGY